MYSYIFFYLTYDYNFYQKKKKKLMTIVDYRIRSFSWMMHSNSAFGTSIHIYFSFCKTKHNISLIFMNIYTIFNLTNIYMKLINKMLNFSLKSDDTLIKSLKIFAWRKHLIIIEIPKKYKKIKLFFLKNNISV